MAATTAAFSLGHGIGDSASIPQLLPWSALALGLLSGLILGGLQGLVLRGSSGRTMGGIWQSAIGFGIGLGLVGAAALLLLDAGRNSVLGWGGLADLMIFVALDGLFIGGSWAALTGRILFESDISLAGKRASV